MRKIVPRIVTMTTALFLAACQPTEGEQTLNWDNLPGDMPPGVIRVDLSEESFRDRFTASQRLPSVTTMSCGPFRIELRANPDSVGTANNILEAERTTTNFNGAFLIIKPPSGFLDRVRFRELLFPDLNAQIFVRQDGVWKDISNPDRTYPAGGISETYRDLYLGFDLSVHPEAFFEGVYVSHFPWNDFITRSIYQNNYPYPEGRYRISFTTPYEMEWPTGSCQFRLPDLEFTYREG
jgi:hypothetical protein